MEGYLDKKGRGKKIAMMRPWSRRYVILDTASQTLCYYSSGDPAKRELKGKFSLKGGSIRESTSKREFVFDVKCDDNEETLTLAASSAAEKSKWILAIIAAAASVSASDQEYTGDSPPPNGGTASRQSLGGGGHSRKLSYSRTVEFEDANSPTPVALVHRKTAVQFRVELALQSDKDLMLPVKVRPFDPSRVVDLLKVNLCSRDQYGNINDSNVYSSAAFLVSLNLLLREDLLHQLSLQNVGPDDISPLLVNCFVLAMVGLSRISLEIFELMDKYVTDLSDVDAAIIDNHRALAEQAFEWCLANKYVDRPLVCDMSLKVKIALYGFVATGKTSLLIRFIDDVFAGNTTSTIGVDFRQKRLVLEDMELDGGRGGGKVSCLVDVWDTAGQEKYRAMTSNFIKGADGVFIVYDASAEDGGDPEEQREGLQYLVPPDFPTVLFGNKTDCISSEARMLQLKVQMRTSKASHFVGSALSGENVNTAFEHLVRQIAKKKIQKQQEEKDLKGESAKKSTIKLKRQSFRATSATKDCC